MANEPQPQNASPEGQSEVKGDKIQEKEVVELSGRRIFLVRHGERMDRVFPGWLRLGFTDLGAYRPYDLNMPLRARVDAAVNMILKLHENTKCNLLFVVHAPTIDAIGRSLMNKPAIGLSNYELSKMGIHFPYASVVALEETNTNGKWQLMPNVLPPISFLDFSNRVNINFFTRS
ncbi:hypothetical protein T4C_4248 [Trichinella pseudospiralis]|uniref:Protein UBASH3A-like protein n=1 Tax=Trichinella pseudospiralis TaxID=6337 RepID=A0A0V1K307_TRIPS|nr:hypothetical protein T4C_4248 [Trichinella pseudospiralis]